MKSRVYAVCVVVVAALPVQAWAGANCKAYPKAEWLSEADAKSKIEAQGYKITKFKVDGNCYEIYGTNNAGKKVEIYFDAKTLDVVKAEVEK